MRIRDVYFCQAMIEWPQVGDWGSTMHHDDEGSLAAQEVDEELEKSVQCESLKMV